MSLLYQTNRISAHLSLNVSQILDIKYICIDRYQELMLFLGHVTEEINLHILKCQKKNLLEVYNEKKYCFELDYIAILLSLSH